ncbi:helix-turn-helix transcriptional regulator [Caldinitratiruptor microaerophilus]|uniref:Helix-turn-helix domain-containing protein n=1 Tax=Caldinitratiruptor microaerophilus TaxID=671077 RepID=A0AA35CJQ8_9FIRM|nr:helix-turn-helix domain-containing protein [Caldinitratiruptor microaerophilus]BDG59623.1 hypothetical protein caldi_07130 [Caldinitratiruptor microaerophilus]
MQATERRLVRVPEGARITGLSVATMYRLIASGKLPVVRIGRAARIDIRDLEAFIAANKTGAA